MIVSVLKPFEWDLCTTRWALCEWTDRQTDIWTGNYGHYTFQWAGTCPQNFPIAWEDLDLRIKYGLIETHRQTTHATCNIYARSACDVALKYCSNTAATRQFLSSEQVGTRSSTDEADSLDTAVQPGA